MFAGVPLLCASQQPSTASPENLPEILITAKHLIVTTKIDRKIYTLDATARALSNSLSDLLNNIPSVDVDPEGVVSLRGSTDVTILIDGKPAPQLTGGAGGQNILSMPSVGIQSIEVLTVPPAQFSAQGATGIINIVTRKDIKELLTGAAQASVGNDNRAFANADVAFHAGPMSIALKVGSRHDVRERSIRSYLTSQESEAGRSLLNSLSAIDETIWQSTPTAGVDAKYASDDVNSIELSIGASNPQRHQHLAQLGSTADATGVVVSSSNGYGLRYDRESDVDESLVWNHKFSRPMEELTISLTRSTQSPDGSYENRVQNGVPLSAIQISRVAQRQRFSDTQGDIDYSFPISKSKTLKVGLSAEKGAYLDSNIGSEIDPDSGTSTPKSLLTDLYSYDQTINAVYASYELKNVAETWDGLFGLRGESAWTRSNDLTGSAVTASTRTSVFPSVHIMHQLSDATALSLAASRRITRPDADSLNPYVSYEHSPNLNGGNPLLRPAISTSIELGCNVSHRKVSYGVTVYDREIADARTVEVSTFGDGLVLTTPTNLDRIRASGLEFSADGGIGPKFSYSVSGDLFYKQVPPEHTGISGLRTTTGLNGKLKLTYRRVSGESLQLSFVRRDRNLTSQGYVAATNIVNAGLQHQLTHDWALESTMSDIFNGQYYQRSLSTQAFSQQYSRFTRGRALYIGVIYSFGAASKSEKLEYEKPDIDESAH